jgi:uncharacterized protein
LESSLACRHCGGHDLIAIGLTGAGTVYSYCSVQVPPTRLRNDAPYVLLMVELDDGPVALGRWASDGEVRIGQRVLGEVDGGQPDLIWFKPPPDANSTSV